MLYTRKGDHGTSGLFGTRERFTKDDPIYEALGTVDELNSLLGLCRAQATDRADHFPWKQTLQTVQEELFVIQAELAGADKHITKEQLTALEQTIDQLEQRMDAPHSFIIPGGTPFAATLDYARAVARRAERAVIRVTPERPIAPESAAFLNRLSSLLYALARYATERAQVAEMHPTYPRN